MGQINSTNLPKYVPDSQLAGTKFKTSSDPSSTATTQSQSLPQDDTQLTRLSGVLNSLKKSASTMRSQLTSVMASVRNGTYEVDALQVSRSIVGESLAPR